ncbi:armadillo-type protein [Mycena galopus ATCC 62051]|nr:armadillo-type protein [Mycena galopus ATCC 62051]
MSTVKSPALHVQQYNQIFQSGQFREAAKIAANSLRGILHTVQVIEASKSAPAPPGGLSPILQYFGMLRNCSRSGSKITSEELGDIVRLNDMTLEGKRPQQGHCLFGRDWSDGEDRLHVMRTNPEKGAEFAAQLVNGESGPLVDVEGPAKSFLLDALKDNKPEWGPLQTRLLEMNLLRTPQVADAILENEMFTHYDRPRIANLCKKAGLLQRALEHYEDLADIKRATVPTAALQPEGVIQIATKYSDILQPVKLIEMFESFKSFEGPPLLLPRLLVNVNEDPQVHFKYIQAATRTSQIPEVERICREINHYNPEKVKNFLKEAKLADQLLLIILCDRFDFGHDLLRSHTSGHWGLLNVDCDKGTIKSLLTSVTGNFPIDELVHEVEQRNRLKLVLPNNNPEVFLKDNNDIVVRPIVVGKFCEKRDPYLAYTAYAKGFCNDELIAITNESSMFKQQARYLVKRCQPDLWAQFLAGGNLHRHQLIDQIVATALSECTDPNNVSITVKAFIQADLPIELIELLEKIIIEPSVLKAAEKAHMWPLYIKYDE